MKKRREDVKLQVRLGESVIMQVRAGRSRK